MRDSSSRGSHKRALACFLLLVAPAAFRHQSKRLKIPAFQVQGTRAPSISQPFMASSSPGRHRWLREFKQANGAQLTARRTVEARPQEGNESWGYVIKDCSRFTPNAMIYKAHEFIHFPFPVPLPSRFFLPLVLLTNRPVCS